MTWVGCMLRTECCPTPNTDRLVCANPPRAYRSVCIVSTHPGPVQHRLGRTHRAQMGFKAKTKGVFAMKPPGEGGIE